MSHLKQLDGIRAIAVLIVVIAHAGLELYVPGGFGVTIFFFLSGYLITSLLRSEFEQTGTISLRNFYIRRVCRINPPLWITLIVVGLLVAFGVIQWPIDTQIVVSQFLFYVNYMASPSHTDGIPVTSLWSLAVEEHFYLFFPLFFLRILSSLSGKQAAQCLLALCAAVLTIRVANVLLLKDFSANGYWTHTRVDSILFGCCLAVWQNPILDKEHCYRPKLTHIACALAVLAACLIIHNEIFRQTLRYTLQGMALFVLFSAVLQQEAEANFVSRALSSWPVRTIGILSYTIYLFHGSVVNFLRQHPSLSHINQAVVGFVVVIAYAAAMYVLVERPLALVRRRFHRTDKDVTPTDILINAPS